MKYRYEFDSLGKIKVPSDKYWGASTQRSNKHFDIGDFLVRPIVIKSIAMIKKAAAIINTKNGDIDKKLSKTIIKASNEVISGKLDEHFPLHVWQTGSGLVAPSIDEFDCHDHRSPWCEDLPGS